MLKPRNIALGLSLLLCLWLFPAREMRAGNCSDLKPHEAGAASFEQSARAAQRRRHSRSNRKRARRGRTRTPARSAASGNSSSTQPLPANGTDIQPSRDAEDGGINPATPAPTPSQEQQFPKAYKIKRP